MLESATLKKNKICLSDYDYKKDIENRILISELTSFDLEVLEEILFSSIKTSLKKLAVNLDVEPSLLIPILKKLNGAGLLHTEKEEIVINKKMRKYFEFEHAKFDEDFKPDIEYLQQLLHKIPIHILPLWYSTPRTSNNILNSIVEKYLTTPQVFQRYLAELISDNSLFGQIINDVYKAPNLTIASEKIVEKYEISKEDFYEIILILEYNFACCLSYKKTETGYQEVITPFYEYKEYLQHYRNTEVNGIEELQNKKNERPLAYVEDLSKILSEAQKPILIKSSKYVDLKNEDYQTIIPYFEYLVQKLSKLKYLKVKNNQITITDLGKDFLTMSLENKALHVYQHPHNSIDSDNFSLYTEKNVREAEKSIIRVLNKGWVYFDDFIKGVMISIQETPILKLTKTGKSWKYNIPEYSEEEAALIKRVIFEWLYEAGIISIGKHENKDCFCVTDFGHTIFDI